MSRGSSLAAARVEEAAGWTLRALAGTVVELSTDGAGSPLTLAFSLVRDARGAGETAVWISGGGGDFYPPDAAEAGADLDALVVVRAGDASGALRAADRLLRSGGFGLVVLDPGVWPARGDGVTARLAGLARRHGTTVVLLVERGPRIPGPGALVGVRAEALRRREERGSGGGVGGGGGGDGCGGGGGGGGDMGGGGSLRSGDGTLRGDFRCRLQVARDRRHPGGWSHEESRRGPDGLR